MSLIRCPECKKSISDTVDNCPHCGYKITLEQKEIKTNLGRNLTGKEIFGFLFFAIIIVCIIGYCSMDTSKKEASNPPNKMPMQASAQPMPTTTNNNSKIKPEMIVRFPRSGPACLTIDALEQAMECAIKGEETKLNALFLSKNNPDGICVMLDMHKKYKVISAEYNHPGMPEAAILEIVGARIKSTSRGAFTLIMNNEMIEVVK